MQLPLASFKRKCKIFITQLAIIVSLIMVSFAIPVFILLGVHRGVNADFYKDFVINIWVFIFIMWVYFVYEIIMMIFLKKNTAMALFKCSYVKKENQSQIEPSIADMIAFCLITFFWILITLITAFIFAIISAIMVKRRHCNMTEKILEIRKVTARKSTSIKEQL